MKNLFYKELKLTVTLATYLFPLLAALMLVPSYPYIVSMLYFIFPIQIAFQVLYANKDNEFTLMLPIKRNEVVLGKHFVVYYSELIQLLYGIPFALISALVLNKNGNPIGMDANFAFFGYVMIGYSIFNIIFLPNYFKTGYKLAVPLILGIVGFLVFCLSFEVLVAFVPIIKCNLDTLDISKLPIQLAFLALGIIVYVGTFFLSYKVSSKNYEGVNI